MKSSPEALILVGRITSVFGIKGWVNVYSYTEPAENILSFKTWLLNPVEGDGQGKRKHTPLARDCVEVKLDDGQKNGKKVIAQIAECQSRDEALRFTRNDIFIHRDELPELDDEVYWIDLEGLRVVNLEGTELGKIKSMMSTGANDVMVVCDQNGKEILIPYVEDHFVVELKLEEGWIKVDWESEID